MCTLGWPVSANVISCCFRTSGYVFPKSWWYMLPDELAAAVAAGVTLALLWTRQRPASSLRGRRLWWLSPLMMLMVLDCIPSRRSSAPEQLLHARGVYSFTERIRETLPSASRSHEFNLSDASFPAASLTMFSMCFKLRFFVEENITSSWDVELYRWNRVWQLAEFMVKYVAGTA